MPHRLPVTKLGVRGREQWWWLRLLEMPSATSTTHIVLQRLAVTHFQENATQSLSGTTTTAAAINQFCGSTTCNLSVLWNIIKWFLSGLYGCRRLSLSHLSTHKRILGRTLSLWMWFHARCTDPQDRKTPAKDTRVAPTAGEPFTETDQ